MWTLPLLTALAMAEPPPLDGSYRGPLCVPVPEPRASHRMSDRDLMKRLGTGWLPQMIWTKGHARHQRLHPARLFLADDLKLDGAQVRAILRAYPPTSKFEARYTQEMSELERMRGKRNMRHVKSNQYEIVLPDPALNRAIRDAKLAAERAFLEGICRFNHGRAREGGQRPNER